MGCLHHKGCGNGGFGGLQAVLPKKNYINEFCKKCAIPCQAHLPGLEAIPICIC
jgi:hypothetical protein